MVRPVDGLRASSIVWGQMRRPDPHDPDDGHIYILEKMFLVNKTQFFTNCK